MPQRNLSEITIEGERLNAFLRGFPQQMASWKPGRVLVVGDIGLDEYVHGDVRRISPEAPVPILEVQKQDSRLGLAANVAQNVASLGGEAFLVSVVGQDSAAEDLGQRLHAANVSPEFLLTDSSRPTTRKLRVMSGPHHIVRVDFEHKRYLSPDMEAQLVERVQGLITKTDAVVIEDYAKGLLSESSIQAIIRASHAQNRKVFVDPNRFTPASYYNGADVITPNREEALAMSGLDYDDLRQSEDFILQVGAALRARMRVKDIVITRGKDGMSVIGENAAVHMPTLARAVFDVTGAGDTVIAALTLATIAGLSLPEACVFGNVAAGVVVGKVGCVPCTKMDLVEYVNQLLESGS